jgi:hypothetical protein
MDSFGSRRPRMPERSPCELLADVAGRVGRRFRLKLRGESEPEPWCPWLIAPVAGYLETGPSGPWPGRAVEWVEIEPAGSGVKVVAEAFAAAGLPAEVVGGSVRVAGTT